MKKVCFLLVIINCISGCNFNTTRTNDPLDKEEAERITNKFYSELLMEEHQNVLPLFSDIFFKDISQNSFIENFKKNNQKLGRLITWDLVDWKTLSVSGTNSKSEYLLIYEVEYSKHKAKETFSMIRENHSIKIIGYDIQSDAFKDIGNISD